jgi:hypothetical protein
VQNEEKQRNGNSSSEKQRKRKFFGKYNCMGKITREKEGK